MTCLVPRCVAAASQTGFCERCWREINEAERQAIARAANGSAAAAVSHHVAKRVATRRAQ